MTWLEELERLRIENKILREGLEYYADPARYDGDHGMFWKIVTNKGQHARLHLKLADEARKGNFLDKRHIRVR